MVSTSGNVHLGPSDDISVDVNERNNENAQDTFLAVNSNDNNRKKKRYPYRPYASSTSRIVKKCGRYNVLNVNIPQKHTRYFKDMGNTLLSIRWRWILVSLCIANATAYLVFTILWIFIVSLEESYMKGKDKVPCIIGGSSFTSYLILVIETITTIGSGEIYPTDCQSGWIIITFQALTGVAIEGALVTAVFVKMSRPNNKNSLKHFSKKAVICLRDGIPCLIFRIQDVQGKYLARTTVKAVLIQRKSMLGGELLPYYFQNLKLEDVGLLIWPQEIVHRITEDSPFWTFSQEDFQKVRFEILVTLEGDSLTTGQPSQSQTSYTNREILWGYRFSPCVEYDNVKEKYVVNEKMFNNAIRHNMPECKSNDLEELVEEMCV